MLAIGVWAFIETLTACAGRKPGTSFHTFLSKERLKRYGLGDSQQIKPLSEALAKDHELWQYNQTPRYCCHVQW